MAFKVITPPDPAVVIPIAQLMTHLKDEGADTTRQAEMQGFLAAALGHAEHYCGKCFGVQILELTLDAFPVDGIELPRGPVKAITSVKYLDEAAAEQTIAPENCVVDDYDSQQAWLLPAAGYSWPTAGDTANAVKVRYEAGSALLPPAVRNALLLFVGHLDMNREAVITGTIATELPMSVKALLDTEKVWAL